MSHVSKDRVSRINLGPGERGLLLAMGAALAMAATRRRGGAGRLALATLAGGLVYKAVSGHSGTYHAFGIRPVHRGRHREQGTLYVTHTLAIAQPPQALYRTWRDLASLPAIFPHLEEVRVIDERRSHWKARAPTGATVEWDSLITLDLPDREIRWQSAPDAEVPNRGIVRFERMPGDRGTAVRVQMIYEPPAGKLGAVVARLLGRDPHAEIVRDLRRWKQRLETGEVPTVAGQPSGR